jgi:ribosome-associated protein
MIDITDEIRLDENEIHEEFIHSTGPGGQNVNKVATAVQIRFDINNSPSLSDEVRERLINLAGKKVSDNGILIIKAKRFRSQDRNRKDAVERLIELIRKAVSPQKPRKRTKPSIASEQRRLEDKRRHGLIKQRRKSVPADEGI